MARRRPPSLTDETNINPYDGRYGPVGFDFESYQQQQSFNPPANEERYGVDPLYQQGASRFGSQPREGLSVGSNSTFNPSGAIYRPIQTQVPTGKEEVRSEPTSYKDAIERVKELNTEDSSQKYQPPSFNIDEFQSLLSKLESSKKAQVAQKGTEGRRSIMSKGMQSAFRNF